ncbi:MAG TPA: acyltransferase [Verrucomicrobiae bacterium]
MFGTYRFALAIFVALSHFGLRVAGFNPGQWAVISFYTLSGLLMERQFQKLSQSGSGISAFYLDRFLRIYPLFFVVLMLALLAQAPPWRVALTNLSLLPLNYAEFTGIHTLIGPTWSLACETHFYLLVPLLVTCSTRTLRVILAASMGIFMLSPFLSHPAFWGYSCILGILFTFTSGILINRRDFITIKVVWSLMLVLLAAFGATKYFHLGLPTGIHINVAIGYLIAAAAVSYLDRCPPNIRWDKYLGLFSYPLFLCHEVVAAFVQGRWPAANPLVLLFASILFSAFLILTVEVPFDRIRYRVRARP